MALDTSQIRSGISGEVSVGPTTATAPASASEALTLFVGLGYLSDGGLVPKPERSTKDLTLWQNNAVGRTFVTGAKTVYAFTLVQTNIDTIGFAWGTEVTQTITEGTYNADPAATGGRKSFVFDAVDGTNLHREYVAAGELTKMTPGGFVNGEAQSYECEVTAYSVPAVFDTSLKSAV